MATKTAENDLDRGAIAALDLLLRAYSTESGDQSMQEEAESIRGAIEREGLAGAIRIQQEFERTETAFHRAEGFDGDVFGAFPANLTLMAARSSSKVETP